MTAPSDADWVNAMNEVARLKAENDALRADAERYRVARDHARLGPHGEWVLILGDPHNVAEQKTHFDRAIDAARSTDPSTGERMP
jgi:hypothetical protein